MRIWTRDQGEVRSVGEVSWSLTFDKEGEKHAAVVNNGACHRAAKQGGDVVK